MYRHLEWSERNIFLSWIMGADFFCGRGHPQEPAEQNPALHFHIITLKKFHCNREGRTANLSEVKDLEFLVHNCTDLGWKVRPTQGNTSTMLLACLPCLAPSSYVLASRSAGRRQWRKDRLSSGSLQGTATSLAPAAHSHNSQDSLPMSSSLFLFLMCISKIAEVTSFSIKM